MLTKYGHLWDWDEGNLPQYGHTGEENLLKSFYEQLWQMYVKRLWDLAQWQAHLFLGEVTGWNNIARIEASLIYYITASQGSNRDSGLCRFTTVRTPEQSPDLLKAYLQRQMWKKGSVLAVRWARKLRAVAITVLLHHPLRPLAECSLSSLGTGAGSQRLLQACAERGGGRAAKCVRIHGAPAQRRNHCRLLRASCCCRKSLYYTEEDNASKHPHCNQ